MWYSKKQVFLFQCDYMLIIVKMRVEMKNRSHRHAINKTRPRYGCQYTKYKMCLSKKACTWIKLINFSQLSFQNVFANVCLQVT